MSFSISARAGKVMALPVISVMILFNTSCSSEEAAIKKEPEKFIVTNPAIIDTVYAKEYVAEIQSAQNVELRARAGGFLEKVHVDEGQRVQAGQILFTLNDRQFREDILQANARLKAAVADLKAADVEMVSTQLLVDRNIISTTELEVLRSKKSALQAKIEEVRSVIALAKLNLSYAQVRAPFAGIINRIPNKAGSLLTEGTLLTTLSNNNDVFAYFNVSEKEYFDLMQRKDQDASSLTLLLPNGNQHPFNGKIETVESEINRSTGNLAFRARFPNKDGLLKHGTTAKLLVNQTLHNGLVIPQKCTFEVQDKLYVYVVDAANTVQLRSFIPKQRLTHLYVVASGLSASDRILYEGIQQVKEGDRILPQPLPFNKLDLQMASHYHSILPTVNHSYDNNLHTETSA